MALLNIFQVNISHKKRKEQSWKDICKYTCVANHYCFAHAVSDRIFHLETSKNSYGFRIALLSFSK